MKKILMTPVTTEDIKDLRAGDIICLSGELVTGRDDVHHRVARGGLTCPYDFVGSAVMHAGPIIREEPGKNTMISIGPTSSVRMEADAADFTRPTGVKIQVGKGGMGERTSAACKEYGAIHCVYPGGCAVSAAAHAEEIKNVYWWELGMPGCLWVTKIKGFGPLTVSIDTEGNNMFVDNEKYHTSRKEECMAPTIDNAKDYMKVEQAWKEGWR